MRHITTFEFQGGEFVFHTSLKSKGQNLKLLVLLKSTSQKKYLLKREFESPLFQNHVGYMLQVHITGISFYSPNQSC